MPRSLIELPQQFKVRMLVFTSLLESGILAYSAIAFAYLVAVPIVLLYYFQVRWFLTGSLERAFICFLVFFFFPGFLLLSPLVNFRPAARKI